MTEESFDHEARLSRLKASIHNLAIHGNARDCLVTAAILDSGLESLFLAYMPKISNRLATKLFGGYGPLESFSAKIDLTYALGLIDEDTHIDLRTIQALRNAFAHPKDDQPHFNSPAIAKKAKGFRRWKLGCDLTELFLVRAVECAKHIEAATDKLMFEHTSKDGD